MALQRIRTWLVGRIQRSPRLHAYLIGAGSVMALFPTEAGDSPVSCHNDREALIGDIRAVDRDMQAACRRVEEAARHAAVRSPSTADLLDGTPDHEHGALGRKAISADARS